MTTQEDVMWLVIADGPHKVMTQFIRSVLDFIEKPHAECISEDKKKVNTDNVANDNIFESLDKAMFDKVKKCTLAMVIGNKLTQICQGANEIREYKLSLAIQKI